MGPMPHTPSFIRSAVLALAFVFTVSAGARAADKEAPAKAPKAETKAETKKADSAAAPKGNFKTAKECQNVLKVTEGGKDTMYYLAANTVAKENHDEVCSGTKPAMVKGVLSEEGKGADKKKILTASEIKFQ
jgi:hypothetical protein